MPEFTPESTYSLRLTQYTGALYVIAVSALYNFSFWSSFDVNVFQYTDLTDLLKLALWPLLGVILAISVGALFDTLLGRDRRDLPAAKASRTPWQEIRAIANTFPEVALIAVMMIGMFIAEVAHGNPARWVTGAILVGFVSFIPVVKTNFGITNIPKPVHTRILFFLTMLSFIAFGLGKQNAENVRKGLDYTRVKPPPGVLSTAGMPETTELRHLGNTGAYTIVLISNGPNVLVLPNREMKSLRLEHV